LSLERIAQERATERLLDEHLTREVDVEITIVSAVGPEKWKAFFIEGRNIGGSRAGSILIGLSPSDPLAALAWAVEDGRQKVVTHVWVDPEARRRGVADLLFSLYKRHVSSTLIAVGPFTPGGLAAAKRAGARIEP
jgi:GNAT superfamily N-acetyltransferase